MMQVKLGDMAAFQQLIEAHQSRVIGFAARMLGDEMEAEDVAQQVFIRVWKSAERYEATARFTTWLYTIARNLVLNELRRRKRHDAQPLENPLQDESAPRAQFADPAERAPDKKSLDEELERAIQKAIEELPEVQRTAIILRRYDDVSYEEIGAILKLSPPAVKSVLFRARNSLREKLRAYLEG